MNDYRLGHVNVRIAFAARRPMSVREIEKYYVGRLKPVVKDAVLAMQDDPDDRVATDLLPSILVTIED